MIFGLVRWAVHNRLVVCLLAVALTAIGTFALLNINIEAYPDPAPAIVEVIAQYPGASAEEVERQITIPLEVALAGMPGLEMTRSKSLFGLSHLRNQFSYGTSYKDARIEVLNRLTLADLPSGVQPTISPTSAIGEIFRYVIRTPKDPAGNDVYTLNDLKSLQDWTLARQFRRIPRIADTVSFGGTVKRYEIQPDPERLRKYNITLSQLEDAIHASNANAGGDYLFQPQSVQVVRGLGLIGDGVDPISQVIPMDEHQYMEARDHLRSEEQRRLKEIREIVLATTNNIPIRVGDVVDGGPQNTLSDVSLRGVTVGSQTRQGQTAVGFPRLDASGHEVLDAQGHRVWDNVDDTVQAIVMLRKNEQSLPAVRDVKTKYAEVNQPGKILPGVTLETFYDRTNLINRTTETVRENVIVGVVLVTLILYVFLNDLRSSLIVAVNIPLALLFAFAMLYFRGVSANLLSLGAVDFGIIVDSSVIMVESIFRRLTSKTQSDLPVPSRILGAAGEVQRSLFYSTLIMVCALLPLFTMTGPEGQIFGPMAEAYAFSLAGALLLALTISPVLCRMFLSKAKETQDNWLVRSLQVFYLKQLEYALHHRYTMVIGFLILVIATGVALPFIGKEFMPELEEGNIYARGTFPNGVSLRESNEKALIARQLIEQYPEVSRILVQTGRPNDGTDPTGFYNAEIFVSLKPEEEWPLVSKNTGFSRHWRPNRSRSKAELVELMNHDLSHAVIGVDWNFSQAIRDNVMEILSGVKGENSIKIIGPDLKELEQIANKAAGELSKIRGIQNVGVFSILGQTNLEFAIDREKCAKWNVSIADVQDALATAVGGKSFTQMVEGERTFDITLRWPERLRMDENQILDIPVDVIKNRVEPSSSDQPANLAITGSNVTQPVSTGSIYLEQPTGVPRRRLRDLVTPINEKGERDPKATFTRSGASTIYREQGERLIAVKFSVRGRDLASAVAEAQERTKHLFAGSYRAQWSGEFEEMNNALERLAIVALLAMVLIVVLLYLALQSVLDVLVVCTNVVVIVIGGIWSLMFMGMNFNISAGVGFISIFGVGMMNGLILVSGFNGLRAAGKPLAEAIRQGVARQVRPLTMIPLTAIFGMLPAAVATKIGSQTQKPLAIVVVGGMLMTLVMLNIIPVLYSFYGHREPPEGAGDMGHS
jgi:cobalt-zinc-cadmium resistance protein CzcA